MAGPVRLRSGRCLPAPQCRHSLTMALLLGAALHAWTLASAGAALLTVPVAPSDCTATGDCYAALRAAVSRCRVHGPDCSIELAPGDYRVECPPGSRPSSAMTEHPAVSLAGLAGPVTFGGAPGRPRPSLLVDYANGGCGAIVAGNASDVRIQHLLIDAWRLPYTVGTLSSDGTPSTVSFTPEDGSLVGDRPGVYSWDAARWSWLDGVAIDSYVVPPGARAVRERADVGLRSAPYTSSVSVHGVVTLDFAAPDTQRAQLKAGQRLYLLHFENMQSWGVHGWNVSGSMTVSNVSLYSTSGMGYRCDLCVGHYALLDSDVSIKPGTIRPLSITADATHFMHHSGSIEIQRSSLQGQGDDGFNVHGNFVPLTTRIDRAQRKVEYTDETGPGWVTGAYTHFVGDDVQFYSRATDQKLGALNKIVAATLTTLTFADPLPVGLKKYDMLLSMRRVSSLEISDSFFGNSNARGLVVSAINATIRRNTFANLSLPGVVFMEGGCGAVAGDYTEGPFSENVLIEGNSFLSTASVNSNLPRICNAAQLQLAGCVPIGLCGVTGGLPVNAIAPTPYNIPALEPPASIVRIQALPLPGGPVEPGSQYPLTIRALKYMSLPPTDSSPLPSPLAGVQMGIYLAEGADPEGGSSGGSSAPMKLLAQIKPDANWSRGENNMTGNSSYWVHAMLEPPLKLQNGSYFLAHWFPSSEFWTAAMVPGRFLEQTSASSGGLPPSFPAGGWKYVAESGLSVAAEWEPVGDWCDIMGTLPPPVLHKPDDRGAGRLTEQAFLDNNRLRFQSEECG
jgi:hypothetical protein